MTAKKKVVARDLQIMCVSVIWAGLEPTALRTVAATTAARVSLALASVISASDTRRAPLVQTVLWGPTEMPRPGSANPVSVTVTVTSLEEPVMIKLAFVSTTPTALIASTVLTATSVTPEMGVVASSTVTTG